MNADIVMDVVAPPAWTEPMANDLQHVVRSAFETTGTVGQEAKAFLQGQWLGHPLHPVLTDLPVGAWTVATILDALDATSGKDTYARGADAAIGIGLIGALGSALSGLADWQSAEDSKVKRVGLAHGLLNVTATTLFGASWFMRKGKNRGAARALAWIGYGIVFFSAYLGGEMVYRMGMGVDSQPR